MRVWEKEKIAFFHIPKTGGTSTVNFIKKQLGKPFLVEKGLFHEPLSVKKDAYNRDFSKLKVFTTVRNPYDHAVSSFYFYRRVFGSPGIGFTDFLHWLNMKEKQPHKMNMYFLPFDKWLLVDGKLPRNVIVLKLEQVDYRIHDAHDWPRPELKVEKENTTHGRFGSIDSYFKTDEQRRLVHKYYRWIVEEKGWYQF